MVRNILLIGRTGNGKTTLANVLFNKNGQFEEVFKESAGSISETRELQIELMKVDLDNEGREQVEYQIIDTIGVGDTRLTPQGVLYKLAKIARSIDNGLNQVLFVVGDRFTKEEAEAYRLLRQIIFDNDVVRYTTIVRTKFPDFEDEDACEADRRALKEERTELADIVNSVKIVYVDNPPMRGRPAQIQLSKEIREASRERLLTHLLNNCQGTYRPSNLAELNDRIRDYLTEEEKLQKEIKEKEQQIKDQEAKMQQELNNLRTQQAQQIQALQVSFQEQMRQANEQRNREIRELEERNRREVGQIHEENERRLRQMQDDSRRQQEESSRLLRELETKKYNSSGIKELATLMSTMSVRSDDSYEISKLREDNKEKVKTIGELQTKINNAEDPYKKEIGEIKQTINSLNTKLEDAKKTAQQEVPKQVEEHVQQTQSSTPSFTGKDVALTLINPLYGMGKVFK